jgi:serine O-acetyltransferase
VTIPDKKGVEITVKKIFRLLFQVNENLHESQSATDIRNSSVKDQVIEILKGLTTDYNKVAEQFFNNLPQIREILIRDAEFILKSDPAARQIEEVIIVYPGFFAIYCYRLAHSIDLLSVPLLPRMITEYAHKVTGIDIHPGAVIGSPVSIDHGTGIVIGETAIIGNNVKIYQGVTLGALSVDKSKASKKRHPTIEDDVILYAGCTILGGETTIGRHSIIGGNVWLTESIAPFSVVYHKSEIIVRDQSGWQEPLNFII